MEAENAGRDGRARVPWSFCILLIFFCSRISQEEFGRMIRKCGHFTPHIGIELKGLVDKVPQVIRFIGDILFADASGWHALQSIAHECDKGLQYYLGSLKSYDIFEFLLKFNSYYLRSRSLSWQSKPKRTVLEFAFGAAAKSILKRFLCRKFFI